MALSPRVLRPRRSVAVPTYAPLGYTRLWGLTSKSGTVSGLAYADTGLYAVRWWDGTTSVQNSGGVFSRSGSGLRAIEVYPTAVSFPDSSPNNLSVLGSGVSVSSTQSKFGGYSGQFAATGGLTVTSPQVCKLSQGGAYCVECWVYRDGTGTQVVFSIGGGVDSWSSTSGLELNCYIDGASIIHEFRSVSNNASITGSFPGSNQWVHVACTYSGSVTRLFVNGALAGSSSVARGVPSASSKLDIGDQNGQYRLLGYVDDLRIVKGSQVYSSAFSVPSSALTAISGTALLVNFDSSSYTASGQFDGFDVSGNEITSLRAESVSLGSTPGGFGWNKTLGKYYFPPAYESGVISSNLLNAAAINQFYTDLLTGTGSINVEGNPGITGDDPTIATAKGYTVYGSVPP